MKKDAVVRRYRPLMIILLVTACAWIGITMSDFSTYPTQYAVRWVGYDDARYAVVRYDSTLYLDLQSNGFRAVGRSLFNRRNVLTIDIRNQMPRQHGESFVVSVGMRPYANGFVKQLHLHGIKGVSCEEDSLRIRLAERRGKAFVPQVKNLEFSFEDACGAVDAFTLITDTVYLYGSAESLAKIKLLTTKPTKISNISKSDTFRVELDPVWEEYADLYASTKYLKISLPVAHFMEMSVDLPVTFDDQEGVHRHKLYPDHVTLTYLVPMDQREQVSTRDFKVSATYVQGLYTDSIPLRVSEFPSIVRVKNITPQYVRYVIIK